MDGQTLIKLAEILLPLGLSGFAVYKATIGSKIKREEALEKFQLDNIYTKKDAQIDLKAQEERHMRELKERDDSHAREIKALHAGNEARIANIVSINEMQVNNMNVQLKDSEKRITALEAENFELKKELTRMKNNT